MEREDLYTVLFRQQKEFEEEDTPLVKRELLGQALKLIPLKLPIIITGVRRCGKSTLLKLVKNELKLKEKSYLYVNFNDEMLTKFSVEDFQKIIDFLTEGGYSENCFLFIDEIQEANGWEKWVDRIKQKYTVFITGSNSKLLNKEISTILTGRSVNLSLTPFCFREFLTAKSVNLDNWKLDLKVQSKIRIELKEFLEIGGFPKRVVSKQGIVLSELYENILYRDIISKFNKNIIRSIKEISAYLLSNPSSLTSLRALSKMVEIKNISTVKSILDSFEGAFLFFFINKFDYSIRKQTQNPRKAYCIDNGFIATLGFRTSENKGKLLENLVAIELKRRGKEIFYYSEKNECDFVIKEGTKITQAIQVCYNLNEENREREIAGLISAMKQFNLKEGLILTYNQDDKFKVEGKTIKVLPIWKWLLESSK
jgi:hypothetical protein